VRRDERTFRLQRYFSITSGVALLIASLALGWAYYREEVGDQIAAAELRSVTLARTFANAISPIADKPDVRTLHERVLALSHGVPVAKIKIYDAAGTATYSSVPAEIGEDSSGNPGFRTALAGRPFSELTHRGAMSVTEGRVENVDVVSTYIPIGEPGHIRAVFELYSDVTDAVAKVQHDAVRLVLVLAVVFGALYAALLFIVSRGDRILQRQFGQLEDERLSRLKRFFSPQVAELIDAGGMDDPLKTHRREITAVSIDLRGFTAFTESAEPEEVIDLLRDYHAAIGKVIVGHQGTIEYFAGDGVMVIFNDPVPVPDAATRAVKMAIEMHAAYEPLAALWRARGHDLGLGTGIAMGYATIGAIGFEGRRDYAAIGSVMNLSARLCGEAKAGQILVDRKVNASAGPQVRTEPIDDLRLKGFAQPVAAFLVRRPAVVRELRPEAAAA
jgi:class 3 adenylate cyclase